MYAIFYKNEKKLHFIMYGFKIYNFENVSFLCVLLTETVVTLTSRKPHIYFHQTMTIIPKNLIAVGRLETYVLQMTHLLYVLLDET